jgi:hypothetical protein
VITAPGTFDPVKQGAYNSPPAILRDRRCTAITLASSISIVDARKLPLAFGTARAVREDVDLKNSRRTRAQCKARMPIPRLERRVNAGTGCRPGLRSTSPSETLVAE